MSLEPTLPPPRIFIFAVLALLFPVAWIEYRVLHYTHGIIAYPLDDTFIHLTLARNFALDHYWGITGNVFASASSSPVYTALLAVVFLIFGAHTVIPLLLNIIVGIILIWASQRWLIRQGLSGLSQLIILLLLIFLTPLPLIIISGMEHTLQLLFSFLFIFSFAEAVGWREVVAPVFDAKVMPPSGKQPSRPVLPWTVYVYGALMVTTRYECLTILGMVCLILLFRRQWVAAVSLGAISILPIVLFGFYAMSKGSYFMPNSVLLKSNIPLNMWGIKMFFKEDIWVKMFFPARDDYNFLSVQRLLLLLPLCALFFLPQVRRRADYRYILIVLTGATLGHIAFAYPANFPRYEDYLIGCSMLIMGTLVAKYTRQLPMLLFKGAGWVASAVIGVLMLPFLIRSGLVFQKSKQYCINTYEQQYQMAQFVHTYYDSTALAFNDIGAISFYSAGPKLDLFGLASIEVARSRRSNRWTAGFADSLSRKENIKLAIVYDTWQDPKLLRRWNKIASWQNYNNVVLGSDSVSFYTINPADTTALRKNLEAFQPSLPSDVRVRYY